MSQAAEDRATRRGGLTYEQIAARTGLSVSTVIRFFRGDSVRLVTAQKIAATLELSLDELFDKDRGARPTGTLAGVRRRSIFRRWRRGEA